MIEWGYLVKMYTKVIWVFWKILCTICIPVVDGHRNFHLNESSALLSHPTHSSQEKASDQSMVQNHTLVDSTRSTKNYQLVSAADGGTCSTLCGDAHIVIEH
jgi:hypothetical protein